MASWWRTISEACLANSGFLDIYIPSIKTHNAAIGSGAGKRDETYDKAEPCGVKA
jgi:hypothetical protein